MIRKLMAGMSGEKKWIDISEWTPSMEIFVSYMNMPQRVTPTEESFSNKTDRIVCSVNVSEPPSLATSVTD